MNASDVSSFLEGRTRAERLAAAIQEEVRTYRDGLDRRGTSIPIFLFGNHSKIRVGAPGLLRICSAFLSGAFSRWDVHYICDALSLSEAEFTSERLRELLEEFANPCIRAEPLCEQEVLSMREELLALRGSR